MSQQAVRGLRRGFHALLFAASRRRAPHWPRSAESPRIGIWGWYGTETHGDRAALGTMIRSLRRALPHAMIKVFSDDVPYTADSIRQLGLAGVLVVGSRQAPWSACDILVVGGGPLMEDRAMRRWFEVVARARLRGVPAVVWGCSVGPLRSREITRCVRRLLALAELRFLREAVAEGLAMGPVELAPDPAFAFVVSEAEQTAAPGGRSAGEGWRLGLCVRTWPQQFDDQPDAVEHEARWSGFKARLAEALDILAARHGARIEFVAMHRRGWDDDLRVASEVVQLMRHREHATLPVRLAELRETVAQIATCDVFIGMRYHSTVFAAGGGCPVVGIEYTVGGGKLTHFFEAMDMNRWVLPLADFKPADLVAAVLEARRERATLGPRFRERLGALAVNTDRPANAIAARMGRAGV